MRNLDKRSVLDVTISGYESYRSVTPVPVNLITWLTSLKYKTQVEQLRKITDKKTRDELKSKLPAITPSGTFSTREIKGLITHSGLLQIDIDYKDNLHIDNFTALKDQICKIKNVAYCGVSVSGRGYWLLIPIAYPERHKEHFEKVKEVFKSFGIIIDGACRDVARLRGISYDPEAYFNHNATRLTAYSITQTQRKITKAAPVGNEVEQYINQIELHGIDITDGYKNWFDIGCSLANEFNESGRNYFHRISRFNKNYSARETDNQYDGCLKGYNYKGCKTFFYWCYQYGIIIEPRATAIKAAFSEVKQPELLEVPEERALKPIAVEEKTEQVTTSETLSRLQKAIEKALPINLKLPVIISPYEKIADPSRFVNTHLKIINAYQHAPKIADPYIERILKFIDVVRIADEVLELTKVA